MNFFFNLKPSYYNKSYHLYAQKVLYLYLQRVDNKNYQIVKSIFITQNLVQVGTQKRDDRYSPLSFKESKNKIFIYFAKDNNM